MPRHGGASQYHDGSLKERTRRARKTRGQRIQSRRDKVAYDAARAKE